jgi:hypothetical protein
MDSTMADTAVKVDEMTRKRDRTRNVMESAKACSGKDGRRSEPAATVRAANAHRRRLRCTARKFGFRSDIGCATSTAPSQERAMLD